MAAAGAKACICLLLIMEETRRSSMEATCFSIKGFTPNTLDSCFLYSSFISSKPCNSFVTTCVLRDLVVSYHVGIDDKDRGREGVLLVDEPVLMEAM